MARLEEREYVYFTTARSVCATCRESVPARIFFFSGKVWQHSLCARCASSPLLIAEDQDWYLRATLNAYPSCAPLAGARPPQKGCPQDCGPCTWHASPCESVEVVAISPEEAHDAVESVLSLMGSVARLYIRAEGQNATASVRACMRPGVRQVILRSPEVEAAPALATLPAEVVLPSSDWDAVDRFTAAGVPVELEAPPDEAGRGLDLMRANEHVGALRITAKGVPVDNAAKTVCEQSSGEISFSDFRPDSSSHPLCWLTCEFGRPPRPVSVHAVMERGAFDCFRAMLCSRWALIRPGVVVPACTVGFLYGET